MAESAQILMNVSEFEDISSATDSLISAIQAFSYTADQSLHVVDILNTIGNKYAISTSDLAESLTRSSAALVAAGNTMEEAVALTAAANTIIQNSESVGNALKTVSMRIRGTTTKELEAAGEDTDGLVENTSKLYSKIKALTAVGGKEGISILGDDGKYLNTYEVLTKIADRWEEIVEVGNDAALLELIAGKTRGSVVAALLQQPDTLKKAYNDAINADGSALKENEKYLDSIQGKIDQFTNATQTMWSNTLNDEGIKWFVEAGTTIVKFIDKLDLLKFAIAGVVAVFNHKRFKIDFVDLFFGKKHITTISAIEKKLKKLTTAAEEASAAFAENPTEQTHHAKVEADKKLYDYQVKMAPKLQKKKQKLKAEAASLRTGSEMDELAPEISRKVKKKHRYEFDEISINAAKKQQRKQGEAQKRTLAILDGDIDEDEWIESQGDVDGEVDDVKLPEEVITDLEQALHSNAADVAAQTEETKEEYVKIIEKVWNGSEPIEIQTDPENVDIDMPQLNVTAENINDVTLETEGFKTELAKMQDEYDELIKTDGFKIMSQQAEEAEKKISRIDEILKQMPESITGGGQQLSADVFQKASYSKEELKIDNMDLFASELDKLSNMDNSGVANYIQNIVDLGDQASATQKSIAAYASTVQDGNYSVQAGTAFIDTHNTALKSSGVAAKAAAIGHAALNAAISMGLSLLIQFAGEGLLKLLGMLKDTIFPLEKLTEELSSLRSELGDVKSELDSVNSELETTKDRIAELNAMPSLSFVQQEELARLEKSNDELERRKALLTNQEERLSKNVAGKAQETVDAQLKDTSFDGDAGTIAASALSMAATGAAAGAIAGSFIPIIGTAIGAVAGGIGGAIGGIAGEVGSERISTEDKLQREIDGYNELINKKRDLENQLLTADTKKGQFLWWETDSEYDKLKKELDKVEGEISETENYIDTTLQNIGANLEGVEYGQGADEALDFYNQIADKWEIAYGSVDAKAKAIEGVLAQDRFSALSDSLDRYVKSLQSGSKGAKKSIENLLNDSADFVAELRAHGVELQDAIDYFTLENGVFNSDTVEGITAQYAHGLQVLDKLKNGAQFIIKGAAVDWNTTGVDGLFDQDTQGKFKARADKFAEILKGVDNTTRQTFMRLAEDVKNGVLTWEKAANSFTASGLVASCRLVEEEISSLNTEVFKDLSDELSGVIDTFGEFGTALESVASSMETLNVAQTQMANSGRISVKTALELMQSTDNWNELLEIEDGNIRLVDNATEILVQSKLDLIKKNLQAALSTVEAQLAEISATEASADMAYTIEESTNLAVQQLAGNMAYLTKLMEAYAKQAAGENVDIDDYIGQAEQAKADVLVQTDYKKNSAVKIGTEALEKKKEELEAMLKMYEGIDSDDEFGNNYDFDKTPGDKYDSDSDGVTDTPKNNWDKLIGKYENELALITNERDLIEAQIDQMEATGGQASAEYYRDLISNSGKEKTLLEKKKKALEEYLQANKYHVDQDTWTEMNNEINATAIAIKECTTNLLEYYNTLEDIDSHYFDQAMDDVSRLGEEIAFVQGLLEDEDVADESGNWTDAGITRLGLYITEMEHAAQSAEQYKQQINNVAGSWDAYQGLLNSADVDGDSARISAENWRLLSDAYGVVITSQEEYKEKTDELTDSMRGEIEAQNTARDGIVQLNEARIDAIKEGIEKEIEAYEDYIDVVQDSLDAERDLYEFKKDISKQTKDIATLERRIASLSGSTNAADVAERRRLEEQLMQSKESLNDSYYNHAKDAQSAALGEEAQAFRDSKEKYIEELELTLDNVEALIQTSMEEILFNADVVYGELNVVANTHGITLSNELINPWQNASAQAKKWKEDVGVYTEECKPFVVALSDEIKKKLGEDGVWKNAEKAAKDFSDFINGDDLKNNVDSSIAKLCTSIQGIVDKWRKVKEAADDAYRAQITANSVGGKQPNNNSGKEDTTSGNNNSSSGKQKMYHVEATLPGDQYAGLVGTGEHASNLEKAKMLAETGLQNNFHAYHKEKGKADDQIYNLWYNNWVDKIKFKTSYYAKGTTGTAKDEWAITDEPWLGDELVLVPTAQGNLQYMRKGTSVIPADITKNLVEWGKISPNMANMSGVGTNLNIINNAVNKPELNLSFDSLVHVDNCSQDTIKDLEKMIDTKINQFSRQLNYSLKKVGAR